MKRAIRLAVDAAERMAQRYGARVDRLEQRWGDVFDLDSITAALKNGPYKLLALVQYRRLTQARWLVFGAC